MAVYMTVYVPICLQILALVAGTDMIMGSLLLVFHIICLGFDVTVLELLDIRERGKDTTDTDATKHQ
jgi:hypothetical protein